MLYILLAIAAIFILMGVVMFVIPATMAVAGTISAWLAVYASIMGIVRGVGDTFQEETPFMHKVYYGDGTKEPAKRSWFFGPCFSVFPFIFNQTFHTIKNQHDAIIDKFDRFTDLVWLVKLFFLPMKWTFILMHYFMGLVLSLTWACLFSALFFVVLVIFYIFYFIIYLIDRLVLRIRGFKNHCPHCNEVSLVPQYVCPNCGEVHKHLVPNGFGVFNHVCTCGCYLGATYFTGKSRLHSICPHCGEPFQTGSTKPFTFQLVGGSNAGKTVYLASLFHEIKAAAAENGAKMTADPACQSALDDLEEIVNSNGVINATEGRDVTFYSTIVDMGKSAPIKFEVVDIPGEMFAGETALNEGIHKMSQYKYADGFIFVVDPFAAGDLLNSLPTDGTATSNIDPVEVFNNFDQYLLSQGFAKADRTIGKPLSVVIAKADTEEVKKNITMDLIREEFDHDPGKYQKSFDACRDAMIREFLTSVGQSALVSNIDARFAQVHYYLVSAMGHAPSVDAPYAPDQVMESAAWIIKDKNGALAKKICPKK